MATSVYSLVERFDPSFLALRQQISFCLRVNTLVIYCGAYFRGIQYLTKEQVRNVDVCFHPVLIKRRLITTHTQEHPVLPVFPVFLEPAQLLNRTKIVFVAPELSRDGARPQL